MLIEKTKLAVFADDIIIFKENPNNLEAMIQALNTERATMGT